MFIILPPELPEPLQLPEPLSIKKDLPTRSEVCTEQALEHSGEVLRVIGLMCRSERVVWPRG